MVRTATQRFGRLDVAFNVAGLGGFGEITELAEADWDLVVDVCLKGVFFSVKHEARSMIANGTGGAIVNVASLNSHVPMFGGVAYCCAKAGVEMLSRNAALELASKRIRVNTISPGLTDTPLTAVMHNVAGVEGAYMDRIPMKRWGTPRGHGRGRAVPRQRRRGLHLGVESVRRRRLGNDGLPEPAAVHVAAYGAVAAGRRPTRQPAKSPINTMTTAPIAIAFTIAPARIVTITRSM